jgi:hypothetical protein
MAKEELDKKTKSPMAKDKFQVLRVLQNKKISNPPPFKEKEKTRHTADVRLTVERRRGE